MASLPGRPTSLVATADQWSRTTRADTTVDPVDGALTLTWDDPAPASSPVGSCPARGLAADRLCRVYRLGAHWVDRLIVGPTASGLDYATLPNPVRIIGAVADPGVPGPDFASGAPSALGDPLGIAIDDDDRLFLADAGTRSIAVVDLWSHRLLRAIATSSSDHPARFPMGVAAAGVSVYVTVREPAGLLRLTAFRGPVEVALPASVDDLPAGAEPSRVAVLPDGRPVVLFHDRDGSGWLVVDGAPPRALGSASDIVVDASGAVVVAPCASPDGTASLHRYVVAADGWSRVFPLDATGYDGGGLVLTRDGRVGYFTASGFRLAVIGAVTYRSEGRCVTYRLDSGVPRNRWGRAFIEACIPPATTCEIGAFATDDDDVVAPLPVTPEAGGSTTGPVHRRPEPSTPWWRPQDRSDAPAVGQHDTYEAPIDTPPGRYLWVTLRLTGNGRRTPRVREMRIERQGHTLMRRLPSVYSSEERQAEFLQRYLATFDGAIYDLDLRARCRDLLVNAHATPIEALDWLASFVGLALDERWAANARRQLVAEIVALYRLRGTVWALSRYIEIFLAGAHATARDRPWVSPVIIEHFRLRGSGGPVVGADPSLSSRSVVGAGFRVGGAVGELGSRPIDPSQTVTSSFAGTAHRFSVLIPRPLSAEEAAAIRHILDMERPAHTAFELCTVDAGLRVGTGLHLGISSIVGPTGAFEAAIADLSLLGRGALLGGASTGLAVEAGRVGTTTRIG
jgi:phage tail-like protein